MDRCKSILGGCAEIFFLQGNLAGALLVAIMLLYPRLALGGIVAILAAYGFAWLIGVGQQFLQAGYYVYNPLLAGLSVGYRCELSPLALLLAALAGIFAFLIAALLARVLVSKMRLPVLSLPFALTSSLVWLVAARYQDVLPLATNEPPLLTSDLGLPLWITGLLKSFGALVFAPDVTAGILLGLLVLYHSRILFLLGVAGYYLGTLVRAMLLGSLQQALLDGNHFNFYLVAMAVGGVFLIPSLRSGLVAMVAVATTSLALEAFVPLGAWTGIPPFTAPYCLVTLVAIYALRVVNSPLIEAGFGRTPEEVRENSLVGRLRYRGNVRTLCLPFSGKWMVWQGCDGRWTHQGNWRYAYDFVVVDEQGRTHGADGAQLQAYYCYRMPVLSPVAGRVIRVVDNMADNQIGTVCSGSNWGNHVVLQDPRGFYVELSHFTPRSIRVKEGEQVQRGSVLGLCGNSGNSPQPHIHVQVQGGESPGAATLPFSFVNYACGDCCHTNDLPHEEDQVEPLCLEKRLDEATSFVVGNVQRYEIVHDGHPTGRLVLRVGIALDGTYYLESDRGKLYFGKHESTFYFYRFEGDDPYLRLLLLALPRLPLAYRNRLQWHDYVPISVATSGFQRVAARLGSLVWPRLASIKVTQSFGGRNLIQSAAESKLLGLQAKAEVELDGQSGIVRVKLGDVELRRIRESNQDVRALSTFEKMDSTRSKIMIVSGILLLGILATAIGIVSETKIDSKVRQAIQQSVQLERSKEYPKAISAVMEQYSTHRDDYLVNLRLGWLNYLKGDYDDADRYYRAAVKAAPDSIEAKLGRLLPLLAAAKSTEAEALAREILKGDPKNYYGNLRLAVALRLQQKTDEARQVVKRMLVAYPADSYYCGEMEQLHAKQVPGVAAATAFAAGTPYSEALKKSVQYEAKQNYAEAIGAISEQSTAYPQDYTLNLRLGWLYYLAADYRNSSRYYFKAMQISPKSIEAGLGYLLPLLAQARYKDAESLARQIVQGDPNNFYGNLRLAFALRMQGEYIQAEKIVQRMLIAHPAGVLFLLEQGMLHMAQNQKEAARAVFTDVLTLDPDNSTAKQQLQGL